MHVIFPLSYRILITKNINIGGRKAHMTKDERIANYKYNVLVHARKCNNISKTCRLFRLSRTTYYEWQERFSKFGYLGLGDRKNSKPEMPNQIRKEYETIIYNYIIDYPTKGLRRIAHELKIRGITISETGIYHVLRSKVLYQRIDRLYYAQEHSDNPVLTERYLRVVENREEAHIESYYPGFLFCQDTF